MMMAGEKGNTGTAVVLLKAKADVNAKSDVRVGLAGYGVVYAEVEYYFGC